MRGLHTRTNTLALAIVVACIVVRCASANTSDPGCTLYCQNGGTCRWRQSSEAQKRQNMIFKYMACDCLYGFAGETCSIPVVRCPDGNLCFHGSTCVKEDGGAHPPLEGGDKYTCDCTTVPQDIVVIGDMCQHMQTESCEAGVEMSRRSFCTNGGSCRQIIQSGGNVHLGCDCRSGFNGPYCEVSAGEFSVGLIGDPVLPNNDDSLRKQEYSSIVGRNIAIVIGCLVSSLALAGVIFGSVIAHRNKPWCGTVQNKEGGSKPRPGSLEENDNSGTVCMEDPGVKTLEEGKDANSRHLHHLDLPRREVATKCDHARAG